MEVRFDSAASQVYGGSNRFGKMKGWVMEHVEQSLGTLFVDLQLSGLWADQKAIADSVLLAPADEIVAAYAKEKGRAHNHGAVDLMAFYHRYFRPARQPEEGYRTNPDHGPKAHLAEVWSQLVRPADDPDVRSSRLPLPHPYVVVGGRFQEVYYWDSYFTQLGLLKTGQFGLVRGMLDNFAYVIGLIGHIPNGCRSYFLTRSQPPFFAAMVRDYGVATGDLAAAYAAYLPAMEAEHRYFTTTAHTVEGLARYWDEASGPRVEMYGHDLAWVDFAVDHPDYFRNLRAACESGWDFSSRWLTDPMDIGTIRTTELWAVDLNCLLLQHEEILAEASGNPAYTAAADARRAAIAGRFFDDRLGFFTDVEIAERCLVAAYHGCWAFPVVCRGRDTGAGRAGGCGDAGQAAGAGRVADNRHHLWPAMGCAEWLGSVELDRNSGPAPLWLY